MRVAILGMGSIGMHFAAALGESSLEIVLIAREEKLQWIRDTGVHARVIDVKGQCADLDHPSGRYQLADENALASVDMLILAIKSQHWPELLSGWVRRQVKLPSLILCLQNGVGFHQQVKSELVCRAGDQIDKSHTQESERWWQGEVLGAVVSFNVIKEDSRFIQTSQGEYFVERSKAMPALWSEFLRIANQGSVPFVVSDNFSGLQWSKLLLNLNNSINALSGKPILEELADRRYRVLLSAAMAEGLQLANAKKIKLEKIRGLSPSLMKRLLSLPDFLFLPLLKITFDMSPTARSSMAQDFVSQSPTEIDYLNGYLERVGEQERIATPINSELTSLVKQVEQEGFRPSALQRVAQALDELSIRASGKII